METSKLSRQLLILVPAFIAMMKTQAHSAQFGAIPLSSVRDGARAEHVCMTENQLAAMVLAVTWPEVTGGATHLSPSPMTMGRSDNHPNLYRDPGLYPRVFWYIGIGAWQLDDSGLGTDYVAGQRIVAYLAAQKTAHEMNRSYCAAGGTPAQRRSVAWRPWYGCTRIAGICETIFNSIYDPATDSLNSLVEDWSVGMYGGMEVRTCRAGARYFTCFYIDWNRAQGDVAWRGTGYGPNPISLPFYSFTVNGTYEFRYWMKDDTGYATSILGRRRFGHDPRRSGLEWFDGEQLCDVTVNRGYCP